MVLQDFNVGIFDLNDVEDEKYGNAVALAYDKVNSRISVSVLFPEPICLKTSISFRGRKIPNGEFDVIVLSSSDTTLVHKSIAKRKHNICYEARLMSVVCQPKLAKPRKVLCYVGPKQVSTLIPFFLVIVFHLHCVHFRLQSKRKFWNSFRNALRPSACVHRPK